MVTVTNWNFLQLYISELQAFAEHMDRQTDRQTSRVQCIMQPRSERAA